MIIAQASVSRSRRSFFTAQSCANASRWYSKCRQCQARRHDVYFCFSFLSFSFLNAYTSQAVTCGLKLLPINRHYLVVRRTVPHESKGKQEWNLVTSVLVGVLVFHSLKFEANFLRKNAISEVACLHRVAVIFMGLSFTAIPAMLQWIYVLVEYMHDRCFRILCDFCCFPNQKAVLQIALSVVNI